MGQSGHETGQKVDNLGHSSDEEEQSKNNVGHNCHETGKMWTIQTRTVMEWGRI